MLIGEVILGGGTGNPQYSPAYARGGNQAIFSFDVLLNVLGGSLVCTIQHKDLTDTLWTGTVLYTFTATTGTGINIATGVTGCKQLYRYMFTLTGNGAARVTINPTLWEDTP